jgi:predicted SAM-dependent methyltransferase
VYGCYVHHEGSQTFKAMDVDYQAICDRNDKHLAERWGKDVWATQLPPFVQGNGVRLNLGCGRFPLAGFVNVDQSREIAADLHANVLALPYEPGTVDEIYAGHLLEHFPYKDGQRALAYWHSLLRDDGLISVAVPDYDVLCARYMENPTPDALREFNDLYIYSDGQESPHQYAYSAALLSECLEAAGFSDLERMPEDHPYFPFAVDWQAGFHAWKRRLHAAE